MIRRQINGIEVFSFEGVDYSAIPHGFFTRNGGVSPSPWNSLNLSTTGGDSRENVIENRKRIFGAIDRPVDSIFDAWQVHGTKIIRVIEPRGLDNLPQKADGLATDNPNVTLFMRFADCVPIFLFDPSKGVVGIFHAGWKGTLAKIVSRGVKIFCDAYQSTPEDIVAGIGPSICSDHYVVKDDVASIVKNTFKNKSNEVLTFSSNKIHFNLSKANEIILRAAGVEKIENSNLCTACDTAKWFSHRAENGATGRFGAYIAVR